MDFAITGGVFDAKLFGVSQRPLKVGRGNATPDTHAMIFMSKSIRGGNVLGPENRTQKLICLNDNSYQMFVTIIFGGKRGIFVENKEVDEIFSFLIPIYLQFFTIQVFLCFLPLFIQFF